MKYRIIPWSTIYSYIPQETVAQGVSRLHLNAFAPGYFKQIWLDDKQSIKDMYSSDKFLNAAPLPSVAISYEIDDDPKNTADAADYPYNYGSHFIAGDLDTYYWKVMSNPESKTTIHASFIRKQITFVLKYLFPTVRDRDDAYNWMTNTFRYGGAPINFHNDLAIYSPIPNTLIEYLALCHGYALNDPASAKILNTELAQYSNGYLRLRQVTMRECKNMWFMVYHLPAMKIFAPNKPEKSDGETSGQVKKTFEITETLVCEPYFPQMFITRVPEMVNGKVTPEKYKPATLASSAGVDSRLLNVRNLELDSSISDLNMGQYQVLSNMEFGMDHNGDDNTDIDTSILPAIHIKIIEKLLRSNANINDYYEIRLYAFNKRLKQEFDYFVDWKTMKVNFINMEMTTSYRMIAVYYKRVVDPILQSFKIHE